MVDVKIGVDAADAVKNIEDLQRVFDKFSAASKEQTATWRGVTQEVGVLGASVEGLHATMLAVADGLQVLVDGQDRLNRATEKTGRHWQFLSRHTKDFAGHIKGATDSLLKWAGISGLVAGVAGFGAEHLVFDFANNVSARRSSAMGYGTTYGGLASARTNYARFGDADAALGNIAGAQADPSRRLGLQNLHVDGSPGRDTTEVLAEAMKSVKDLLDRKPAGIGLAQYSQNMHLDDVFSMGDLQRLQNTSRDEVRGQADRMLSDRKGLDLAPDVQKKWQDLSTQLSKAGTAIETVLVNRLVALEPGLQKLSDAFTQAATTLLAKDGPAAQWLGELDKGLEWLAKKLDDPSTQKNIGDFLTQVEHAAEFVWGAGKKALELLHWLAQLTGDDSASSTASDQGVTPLAGGDGINPGAGRAGMAELRRRMQEMQAPRGHGRAALGTGASAGRGSTGRNTSDVMRGLEDQLREDGVAPEHIHAAAAALMGNVVQESGGDPTKVHDHGTGYGIYGARLDRRDKMLAWLAAHKYGSDDAYGQAREMAHSAMSRYPRTAAALRGATGDNLGDVTNTVATNFESPAPVTANYGGRRNNAAAAYARPAPAPAKVTVSRATGANPVTATAAAAAPQ